MVLTAARISSSFSSFLGERDPPDAHTVLSPTPRPVAKRGGAAIGRFPMTSKMEEVIARGLEATDGDRDATLEFAMQTA